jgi:hypothetical protein
MLKDKREARRAKNGQPVFRCNECRKEKLLTEFHKSNKWSPTGHQYKCKDCMKKVSKKYRDLKKSRKASGNQANFDGLAQLIAKWLEKNITK